MAKSHKSTRKDFGQFKAEFLRCVDLLNLNDWLITFKFEPLDNSYAMIETWSDRFSASVTFNSETIGDHGVDAFNPKRHARHEAGHLFLARMQYIGRQRYVRPDDFEEESERMCRVMERILEP